MSTKKSFLLEIGCEEMPSAPLIHATAQLKDLAKKKLDKLGLAYGVIESHSTPRRLVLQVAELAAETEAIDEVLRGPKVQIAFDEAGNPTKAAEGFARKCGIQASELVVKTDADGNDYVFAEKHVAAKDALPLLSSFSEELISEIEWPNYRSQRWAAETQTFVRPIRWILALFGDEQVAVKYADVKSSNFTRGHRVLAAGDHQVENAEAYNKVLSEAFVLLEDERREKILAGVKEIEAARPGSRVDMPKKVFDEVVNLCEWPTVLVGAFDEEFLQVPQEIICESMLSNQRYFPIYDDSGQLTREFVIVSNADPKANETVIAGNERVVRARLDDAKFFYEEDLKKPLIDNLEKLKRVVFQEKLGTVFQKAQRMSHLAEAVAHEAGLAAPLCALANRAGLLAKCDLVSQAVVEFTSQQGVMGGYYAAAAGEDPEVACAISEHYRPRFAKDVLPSTAIAKAVAVADKLDTVTGIFAIGEPPTGSSDPFAVRRSAIGILAMLEELPAADLKTLISLSLELYAAQGLTFNKADIQAQVEEFFLGRLASSAKDEGIAADVIEAISATRIINPAEFKMRARSLAEVRAGQLETFENLAVAYARAAHLCDSALGTNPDESLFGAAESSLFAATQIAEAQIKAALASSNFAAAVEALSALREPIDAFFDAVMVMDEDLKLRENRLRLLNAFVEIFKPVADFSALARKK